MRHCHCPTVSSSGEGKQCVDERVPVGCHISAVPRRRLVWEAVRPWASGAVSGRCDCVMGSDEEV